MALPIHKCFFLFSLRQGTMLIGVVELFLSAFGLFLLLLGSAHAQEMASMLEADIEDSAQREGIVLSSEDSSLQHELFINPYSRNEIHLHKAQHLAVVVIISLYTGVALATVLLFSCILLLYGAIMRIRQLLLPWISIVLLGLVFCCTAMLVSMFLAHGSRAVAIFAVGSLHIGTGFYLWLVVYSYYRELCESELAVCSAQHHTLKYDFVILKKERELFYSSSMVHATERKEVFVNLGIQNLILKSGVESVEPLHSLMKKQHKKNDKGHYHY